MRRPILHSGYPKRILRQLVLPGSDESRAAWSCSQVTLRVTGYGHRAPHCSARPPTPPVPWLSTTILAWEIERFKCFASEFAGQNATDNHSIFSASSVMTRTAAEGDQFLSISRSTTRSRFRRISAISDWERTTISFTSA
jgi:hypothetical protein